MPKEILIVDDDPIVRDMLALVLEHHGYEPISVPNGQAALDYVRENPPALIVSDIIMPVMDGWTLYRALRMQAEYVNIPFVAMSSVYVANDIHQRIVPDAILKKPIKPEQLLRVIDDILANKADI